MESAIGITLDGVLIFPNLDEATDDVYVDSWTPSTNKANESSLDNYSTKQMD